MIRGSTDSDDEVPKTMKISSLMYLTKRQMPKPCHRAIAAQHDEDEQQARRVEAGDQCPELRQRPDTEIADRERHRAERAERRRLHDDADDAEQHASTACSMHSSSGAPAAPSRSEREPEQDGDEQHLEDVALRERVRRCSSE